MLKGETNTSDASDKDIAEVSDNIYSSIHAASDAIRNIEQNQKTKVITLICHKSLSTLPKPSQALSWGLAQQEGFLQLDGVLESELFMHGLSLSLLARQFHLL